MKRVVGLILCTMLSACESHYATNAEKMYLKSHNGADVQVPAPLTSSEISHFYDLPPQTQSAEVSIEPPTV